MPAMLSKLQFAAFRNAIREFKTSAAVKNYPQYNFRERMMEKQTHAVDSMKMLYGIWFGVATPLLLGYGYMVYGLEVEHAKHPRPKFIPYEHIYGSHNKVLPWRDGVKNLIYHSINNATPDGYENPDPREEHAHED